MKILVSDALDEGAVQSMKNAGLDVTFQPGMSAEELIKEIPQYECLALRSATKVTAAVIEAASNLKLIVRAGVGIDNVDAKAAKEKNIRVTNTPNATTITVAEHTLALMLSLARHIPQANQSVKEGAWDRKSFKGVELKDQVLGIVGFGRIGQEVAKRAQAFGMQVIANDSNIHLEVAQALEVELLTLEELLQKSDWVSVHLPLTEQTHHLFNQATFKKMKTGAFLINAARGGIIDEADLAAAIQSGQIRGAAFDVYETEPPAKDNPLIGLSQVITVPHLGASTDAGQFRAGQEAADIIIEFSKNL